MEAIRKELDALNEAMDKLARPFGYRVGNSILEYLANYPDGKNMWDAFADQIEQKILPKMRGVETQIENAEDALNNILSFIERTKDTELKNAYDEALQISRMNGIFMWRGVSRS